MGKIRTSLNFSPHGAQKTILNSDARFEIVCSGRRFGKTMVASRKLLKFIYSRKRKTRGWIVAPTFILTKEIEREIYPIIQPLIVRHVKSDRMYELVGGHIIEIRSADSENLVGAGLDWLVIDEAAQIKDEVWFRYLRPTLTDRKGRALIISTPRGRNWFWELFERGRDPDYPEYRSFQYPSSANPHLDPKELDSAKKELPELIFRQEYNAEFLDDTSSFFRKVERAVNPESCREDAEGWVSPVYECQKCGHSFILREKNEIPFCRYCKVEVLPKKENEAVHYIGVDLAKDVDFTVVTVVRYIPGEKKLKTVYFDRFNKLDYTVQKERIKAVYDLFGGIIVMDETGVGAPIVEDLQLTGIPVTGIKFTNELKLRICSKLAVKFEREQIEIPDEPILIRELKQFEADRTSEGRMKLGAPPGKHDDCVISLALAVWETPCLEIGG